MKGLNTLDTVVKEIICNRNTILGEADGVQTSTSNNRTRGKNSMIIQEEGIVSKSADQGASDNPRTGGLVAARIDGKAGRISGGVDDIPPRACEHRSDADLLGSGPESGCVAATVLLEHLDCCRADSGKVGIDQRARTGEGECILTCPPIDAGRRNLGGVAEHKSVIAAASGQSRREISKRRYRSDGVVSGAADQGLQA